MSPPSSHAFLELLHTERRYTTDIRTLLNIYLHQLARFPPLEIPHAHCSLITRNTHQLLAHHSRFLARLEALFADKAVEDLQDPGVIRRLSEQVARLFLEAAEKGRWGVYEEYCAGHRVASELTREYAETKGEQWGSFMRYCDGLMEPPSSHSLDKALAAKANSVKKPKRRLTFQDYLIMPIQRICRYPLLLGAAFGPFTCAPGGTLSVQERAMEAMKGVLRAVDRREGEERMRTVRRRLGLHVGVAGFPASTISIPSTTDALGGNIKESGDDCTENGEGAGADAGVSSPTNAVEGVELVLTGAVQARVPTSNEWEYLAAFLTRSNPPGSTTSTTSPTSKSNSSTSKVILLLARVERAFPSSEDLLSSTQPLPESLSSSASASPFPTSRSYDASLAERWKYEVVWGVTLSPSSDPTGAVFEGEICNRPPNALRFVPRKGSARRVAGSKAKVTEENGPTRIKLTRRRSKSASECVSSDEDEKRGSIDHSIRPRAMSASIAEKDSKSKFVINTNPVAGVSGLPSQSLTIPGTYTSAPKLRVSTSTNVIPARSTPSISISESPTETTFGGGHRRHPSDGARSLASSHSHSDAGSMNGHAHGYCSDAGTTPKRRKLQKRDSRTLHAPIPVPALSLTSHPSRSFLSPSNRHTIAGTLPTIPSPSLELGNGQEGTDSESHSNSHSQDGCSSSACASIGRPRKLMKKSRSAKAFSAPPSPTEVITAPLPDPMPAPARANSSSFAIVSGRRGGSRFGSAPVNAAVPVPDTGGLERAATESGTRKNKRKSKIFFLHPSGTGGVVDEPEEMGTGDEGTGSEGDGLVMIRTACAGERDVWIEKMRECGVFVGDADETPSERTQGVDSTPTAWQARHAKGLARAKSTSAVDASFRTERQRQHQRFASSTPPDEPPVPELSASAPVPSPSSLTFSIDPRPLREKGRAKAMSDLGHGVSDSEAYLPRSRSSFLVRFPSGMSSAYKDLSTSTSQSQVRALSGSSPSLAASVSSYPYSYSAILRSGSKRVFNYHRGSLTAASASGSTVWMKDREKVDEGIADIASDVLIRKRARAKMEGEDSFPISKRPQVPHSELPPVPIPSRSATPTPTPKDLMSASSATSFFFSSPSTATATPTTTPEEEPLKRSSTLARIHSVRSVLSFSFGQSGDAVGSSSGMSSIGAGIRRSMTFSVGGGDRKGKRKARFANVDGDMSSSAPTSATNSPLYETIGLPAVVSGEEVNSAVEYGQSNNAALVDKPLPGKPLPSTPSGLRFKSESTSSLPPPPSGDMRASFCFPSSDAEQFGEWSRNSRAKSTIGLPRVLKSSRPHSKLIPPEHRQPVEFIKPTVNSLFSGSFRVRREASVGNLLRSSTSKARLSQSISGLPNDTAERRPTLLQRTLTLGRGSRSRSRSNADTRGKVAAKEAPVDTMSINDGFVVVNEVPPELPEKPSTVPQMYGGKRSHDSLMSAIAINVRLSRELSNAIDTIPSESSNPDPFPEVPQKDFPPVMSSATYPKLRSPPSRNSLNVASRRSSHHALNPHYPVFPGAFDTLSPQTTRVEG